MLNTKNWCHVSKHLFSRKQPFPVIFLYSQLIVWCATANTSSFRPSAGLKLDRIPRRETRVSGTARLDISLQRFLLKGQKHGINLNRSESRNGLWAQLEVIGAFTGRLDSWINWLNRLNWLNGLNFARLRQPGIWRPGSGCRQAL